MKIVDLRTEVSKALVSKAYVEAFHEAAFAKGVHLHPSDVSGPMHPITEEHDKYFDLSKPHQVVPMRDIFSTKSQRESTPDRMGSVETAHHLMSTAAAGGSKRAPISVSKHPSGKYHIEDGNATYGVAVHSNWKTLPVNVVDPVSKAFYPVSVSKAIGAHLSSAVSNAPAAHNFTPPVAGVHAPHAALSSDEAFPPEWLHKPAKAVQPSSDLDELVQHAKVHKEHMDRIIDHSEGVCTQMGFHIVHGPMTREDYDESHRKGGFVQLAGLKGTNDGGKRMREKIRDDYKGDATKLTDISRATIGVSHPSDIPHLIHRLHAHGMDVARRPKNGFEDTDSTGYQDIKLHPAVNGHVGELQIMPIDMHEAKEHGIAGYAAGHKMYEEIRDNKTPQHVRENLEQKSRELYGEASQRMMRRKPSLAMRKSASVKHFRSKRAIIHRRTEQMEGKTRIIDLRAPGHYEFKGLPVNVTTQYGIPHLFNGSEFKPILGHDLGSFYHEAEPIDKARYNELIKERKDWLAHKGK